MKRIKNRFDINPTEVRAVAVDIALFQPEKRFFFVIGNEVDQASYSLGPNSSLPVSSCWNSGSLRIGSQIGSILGRATETGSPEGEQKKQPESLPPIDL